MKNDKSGRSRFNTKLSAYSAAAGAALLAAPAAHATIQNITEFSLNGGSSYSATPPSVAGFSTANFLAATAGLIVGLKSGFINVNTQQGRSFAYTVHMEVGGAVVGHIAGAGDFISNLALGVQIPGKNFAGENINLALRSSFPSLGANSNGHFLPHGANAHDTGYVGFKTIQRGHTYYGWVRVEVSNNANGNPDAVKLVAKNGDPGVYGAFGLAGDGITAGEIAAVPEPSTLAIGGLALLALGARGVKEMRRRRQAVSKG